MFTGIIEGLAKVVHIDRQEDFCSIILAEELSKNTLNVGESVSINGVCLTVVDLSNKGVHFDIINETLNKTNLSKLKIQDKVNFERSLKVGDRISGHFVHGHIECLGKICSKNTKNNETKIIVEIDNMFEKYCVYKGSICLDGISLTISNINSNRIELSIIPHTLNNTTLFFKDVNDYLNVETDLLCKLVEKKLQYLKERV